jgi:hypothetical protein
MKKGESIVLSGYGVLPITDVTTRTYAGVSRSTVFVDYTMTGFFTMHFYWDQTTGVLVEMYMSATVPTTYTVSMKATETNMWSTGLFGLDPMIFAAIIIPIIIVISIVAVIIKKRKLPPQPVSSAEKNAPTETES